MMKKIEEIRSYCLNCKNSQCRIKGCPLGNCIPEFIHEVDSKKRMKYCVILLYFQQYVEEYVHMKSNVREVVFVE